jgi:hypothetical protein
MARAPLDKLPPGTVFARDFRVVAFRSEGGMGVVYEAEQLSTERRVALKVMRAALQAGFPPLTTMLARTCAGAVDLSPTLDEISR